MAPAGSRSNSYSSDPSYAASYSTPRPSANPNPPPRVKSNTEGRGTKARSSGESCVHGAGSARNMGRPFGAGAIAASAWLLVRHTAAHDETRQVKVRAFFMQARLGALDRCHASIQRQSRVDSMCTAVTNSSFMPLPQLSKDVCRCESGRSVLVNHGLLRYRADINTRHFGCLCDASLLDAGACKLVLQFTC